MIVGATDKERDMPKESITFRLDKAKRAALDSIAAAKDRDRSEVIEEAIEAYIEVQHWQIAHIKEGLRQADAGEFVSNERVKKALAKWRK
jgi:predicted transcriptional regulator